ncbi:MAG: phage replisome organizer N-terminal domain-containing protein [Arcobacteraceae bacterium]|nr:phage replisome organizer N-terminal domain-containing protein [Arcobacteraceae bacterium]
MENNPAERQKENPRYYWMKLFNNFFQDPKIKKLKRMAGGDTYIVIILKIMLETITNNGVYKFQNIEKNLADELELKIDEDSKNIQVVLDYLYAQKMIVKLASDSFLLTDVKNCIGSETASTKRSQKSRKGKKEQKMLQCNTTATNGNIERELSLKRECSLSSIYSNYVGKDFEFITIKNIEEIEEGKILLFSFDKKILKSKISKFFSCEQLEQKLKIFENGGYFDGNQIRSC